MKHRVHGFTLIETLIALLLMSLGLLGAWGLLLSGLHTHADAQRRALAVALARDMADRIRANPRAQAAYASPDPTADPDGCDTSPACDASQRAAADLAHFARSAQFSLPGADTATSVEFAPAIGVTTTDRYAITLRWRATRDVDQVTLQLLLAPVAG